MNLGINTSPSKNDLKKIENWLLEEYQNFNEGFYCNWNIIEKAQVNNQLVTLQSDNESIGFIVWNQGEIFTEIDIMEINPSLRKKGIGKAFLKKFEDYISKKGSVAIKLFCSPRESEFFWKKMNFIKFPNRDSSESDLTYFKPLIEFNEPIDLEATNKVELWDLEPYQIKENKPKWRWKINPDNTFKPIIQPCNADWNLRWTKNGKIVKEGKVKYFQRDNNRIEFSPFLYIRKLTE